MIALPSFPLNHRQAESELVPEMVKFVSNVGTDWTNVRSRSQALLTKMRFAQSKGVINQFLVQYGLSSEEGLALLSLAEAFLRVPDAGTADALIADKLSGTNWRAHTGASESRLVNSATWGLVLTQFIVGDGRTANVMRKLVARAGEPFVRAGVAQAMSVMGNVFVMGRTIEEALSRMDTAQNRGFTASFDMLGEAARTPTDADQYLGEYERAIKAVGAHGKGAHSVSIKLSALHPRYEIAHAKEAIGSLTERMIHLTKLAADRGIAVAIDAEESDRLEMSLAIIEAVTNASPLSGWEDFGFAVQAYSKRASDVIAWTQDLGVRSHRLLGVRLVKGAYWDTEIKLAQERGLEDFPVFTRKTTTDLNYLHCARRLLDASNIRPAFASHNAVTVATICEWAGKSRDFEFQRLHGMGEGLYEDLVRHEGYACRTYAPVGSHENLLAYLVRRLLENGANSSFVHQMADKSRSDDVILQDPLTAVASLSEIHNPIVTKPRALFEPDRCNSQGIDLQSGSVLWALAGEVRTRIAAGTAERAEDLTATDAVRRAQSVFTQWKSVPVADRAACLDRLGDELEADSTGLISLLVGEAKKSMQDALSEVREAVDFCRYYAVQARKLQTETVLPGPTGERNVHYYAPRGVWLAISPWNFPLAIFIGQVAAALVTGNTVVAKPAPQTPLIARKARSLAIKAGIPSDAFVLIEGDANVGAQLVSHSGVSGVVFTGSTGTARRIATGLLEDASRPLTPLIAETGGINAMIVDSTALAEQVVRDVVISAFQSAGQRCSALRLLVLQEDIEAEILEMLSGAMDTLRLGDPLNPATDVGPVIDQGAYQKLMEYRASRRHDWIKTLDEVEYPLVVPPTVIRNRSVTQLDREWFGPILHTTTWPAGKLEDTVAQINGSGFGLTLGVHSRIAETAATVIRHADVGNIYVNRSMIGAVVGSQPFGGEGHSGTGPKAGGPNYLQRFCSERVVSTDTTSAGGNALLFASDAP